MPLPKTTQDRIERDAIEYMHSEIKGMVGDTDELQPSSLKYAHIAGATAEATKTFEMYKMLVLLSQYHYQAKEGRELNHDAIIGKIEEHLQQWNAGGEIDRPCPHCGKELNRDRNLCRECGKEVEI